MQCLISREGCAPEGSECVGEGLETKGLDWKLSCFGLFSGVALVMETLTNRSRSSSMSRCDEECSFFL